MSELRHAAFNMKHPSEAQSEICLLKSEIVATEHYFFLNLSITASSYFALSGITWSVMSFGTVMLST